MVRRLLLTLIALSVVPASFAGTRLVAGTPSQLVLEGSSNVAPWRCTGTTLDGQMQVAAPLDQINAVIDHIEDGNIARWMENPSAARFPQPSFRLRVPVSALRCGNGQMERDMSRALRADAFPAIEFRFNEVVGGVAHDIDRGTYQANVTGTLAMAGSRKAITIAVQVERLARNRFRLRATLPLRMTDFSVQPPTALFGLIHARNDVLVHFDLVLDAT